MKKLVWTFLFVVVVVVVVVVTACNPSRQLPADMAKDSTTTDCTKCSAANDREWFILQGEKSSALNSIFAIDPNHFYAGGTCFVLEYASGIWNLHYEIANVLDLKVGGTVMGIWGDRGKSIYAATTGGIVHWDGIEWKKEINDPLLGFLDIWGLSQNAIFASAFNKQFSYYDGASWEAFELTDDELTPGSLVAIWPLRKDWVLFATQGAVYRWDGTLAEALFKLDDAFVSVWAADENDVFAATAKTAVRYKEGRLETSPWPITERSHIHGIWGFGSDEVYAVGEGINTSQSLVLRFDGTSWQQVDTGTNIYSLRDVTGDQQGNLYAVSGEGQVLIGLQR